MSSELSLTVENLEKTIVRDAIPENALPVHFNVG